MTAALEHLSHLRSFVRRELDRRVRENAGRIGVYPTAEEARAALTSLDELAVALDAPPPPVVHIRHVQELTA